jgi:hypothetical protein
MRLAARGIWAHLPELDDPIRFLGIFMKVILPQIEAYPLLCLGRKPISAFWPLVAIFQRIPRFIVENVYAGRSFR